MSTSELVSQRMQPMTIFFSTTHVCVHVSLCDPVDCSLPGSSVHRILQARILQWVAISYSRGSSQPRDWTLVSCFGRWILYHCTTWEAPTIHETFTKMDYALGHKENLTNLFKRRPKKLHSLTTVQHPSNTPVSSEFKCCACSRHLHESDISEWVTSKFFP